MPLRFTLYTRQGCHLCEAFLYELRGFDKALLNTIRLIDIDDDESTQQQYGDKVPILFAGSVEICRYYFDADKLNSCLKLQGDSLE